MPGLGASTRLYGVLGWPVAHSLSPLMHGAAFAALGLDAAYAAFAVQRERLAEAVRGARALGIAGLNLTLPHKEAALALCQPDAAARAIGAVNTLRFDGDTVLGTNTDAPGFAAMLREAGVAASGVRALLLGAGGAARAVLHALSSASASVTVASRAGRGLAIEGARPAALPLERSALLSALPCCDLLVDCTGRGLGPLLPLSDLYPELDLSLLPGSALVIDLCVRPDTSLCRAARARGLRALTGEGMLLHQGALALGFWLGQPVPEAVVEVMRAALAGVLLSCGPK